MVTVLYSSCISHGHFLYYKLLTNSPTRSLCELHPPPPLKLKLSFNYIGVDYMNYVFLHSDLSHANFIYRGKNKLTDEIAGHK